MANANDATNAGMPTTTNAAGSMARTTAQTRKIETIAASEAAPASGKGLPAEAAASRASAIVTAVEETIAPVSELTSRPRVLPRTRTAT